MTIQSEYYDPDTGIIHINQIDTFGSIGVGVNEGAELGLEDTSFDDVKVKLLSVEYNVRGYATKTNMDWNTDAFDYAGQAAGQIIFGVCNKNESITSFSGLSSFSGTSAWPVAVKPFFTVYGNTFSVSKTWKPRKTALSNEQNAFITIRNESATSAQYLYAWHSIYIRMVRL